MAPAADPIKTIEGALALGFSLTEAIQRALDESLASWGRRVGHRRSEISMALNGYHGRVYPEIRDALCGELDIPREYLDRLIGDQAKRRADSEEPAA